MLILLIIFALGILALLGYALIDIIPFVFAMGWNFLGYLMIPLFIPAGWIAVFICDRFVKSKSGDAYKAIESKVFNWVFGIWIVFLAGVGVWLYVDQPWEKDAIEWSSEIRRADRRMTKNEYRVLNEKDRGLSVVTAKHLTVDEMMPLLKRMRTENPDVLTVVFYEAQNHDYYAFVTLKTDGEMEVVSENPVTSKWETRIVK